LDLVPLSPHPVLPSTKRIDMNVFLSVLDDGRNHGTFNNITYVMPLVPTLISVLTLSDDDVQDSAVYGQTGSHIINQGEVIDLVINNYDGGAHPCKFFLFYSYNDDFYFLFLFCENNR